VILTDEAHSFDANGNLNSTGYTVGTNNRITTDGTYNYEYDDEGNLSKRTHISSGNYEVYDWDHRNRLGTGKGDRNGKRGQVQIATIGGVARVMGENRGSARVLLDDASRLVRSLSL